MFNFKKKSDTLVHSTIRIECVLNSSEFSFGTGFFYNFKSTEKGGVICIVTNKHVIEDSIVGTLKIPLVNAYNGKKYHDITIEDFEEQWISHTDKDVDLCILPIASYINIPHLMENGLVLDIECLDDSMLPSKDDIKGFGAIEEIIMIGYPNGLMDEINMKPIVRSGISATSLQNDYEGNREFLIDIACFGGSSGSPIFIYKEGAFLNKEGGINVGTYLSFVGILYAGWDQYIEQGENMLIKRKKLSEIIVPLNLGIAIKSERIKDFTAWIDEQLKAEP